MLILEVLKLSSAHVHEGCDQLLVEEFENGLFLNEVFSYVVFNVFSKVVCRHDLILKEGGIDVSGFGRWLEGREGTGVAKLAIVEAGHLVLLQVAKPLEVVVGPHHLGGTALEAVHPRGHNFKAMVIYNQD